MGALSNLGGDAGLTKVPIIGGMFSDPNDRQKVQNLQDMSTQYQWRRPMQAQAYMNALQNRSQAYRGAGDALASMYGAKEGQMPDVSKNPGEGLVGPGGISSLFHQGNLRADESSGTPYKDQFNQSGAGAPIMPADLGHFAGEVSKGRG